MLVNANLLLDAIDASSPRHRSASRWLTDALNGDRAVAIPWQTIGAFLRISTHPRVFARPLAAADAWNDIEAWVLAEPTWIPAATETTLRVYGNLTRSLAVSGNLVPDVMLAALAIESGIELMSADGDFARFAGLRWRNPLAS